MITLKFRAWDAQRKRFFTSPDWVDWIIDKNGVLSARNYLPPKLNKYQNLSIQQYTGLKDKNGKEIYDGDIVRTGDCIYTIRFENCGFVALHKGKHGNDIASHMLCTYEFEIIGNIYENPELLEVENDS